MKRLDNENINIKTSLERDASIAHRNMLQASQRRRI